MEKTHLKPRQHPQKRKGAETKNEESGRSRIKNILPLIIVFCLPVLLYMHTIRFGFSGFDDDKMITEKVAFLSDFGNVSRVFLTDQFLMESGAFYRPLGTLSYMVDIQLSGGVNAWMFHLMNLLLLGFIACSLFLLLKRFSIPPKLALFSALIFCVHPLFVSATAHLPNRAELLLILFSLLSFLFLTEFLQKRKISYLLLHWGAFTLALFSKETAAFLPFLFIIYYFTFSFKNSVEKKHLLLIALYAISGACWFWLRSMTIDNSAIPDNEFGLSPFLLNLRVIPESLARFFLPSDTAPIPGFSLFNTLAGIVIMGLIAFMFLRNKERSAKEKVFCFSWFLILLVPSLLFKHPNFDYLDHRFFLPMTGILLFVLFSIPATWLKNDTIKKPWIPVALFVGLSVFSIVKSLAYSDPMTFYTTAIEQNAKCDLAYFNRGVLYHYQGLNTKAINDYTKAIELKPDFEDAFFNRALIYNDMGAFDKAINDYTKSIELNPDQIDAYINRGNIYGRQDMFEQAIADFTRVIESTPDYFMAYNNRGGIYGKQGLNDKAISDFTSAIEINPDFAEGYHNRGMMYGNKGLYDKAIADFTKAIELMPDQAENYNNRGIVYSVMGLPDEACRDFEKAGALGSEEAKRNMASLCK